ncbi:MAG: [NiFe]-hydrogenase assembly chaperone HybE [Hydrogenophilus sp.]|nr:[NiFe]-hydrogenase assembly chaperone HybE [Hydrogenophilus sp.]
MEARTESGKREGIMIVIHRDNPAPLIESLFGRIRDERMADLPFLNPRIEVAAVGFTRHGPEWRGILVAPWVIALMLLPATDEWTPPPPRQRAFRTYPAGTFAFLANEEEEIGTYLSCPLISDLRLFPDHSTAIATAHQCLLLLDQPLNNPPPPQEPPSRSRRRFFLLGC